MPTLPTFPMPITGSTAALRRLAVDFYGRDTIFDVDGELIRISKRTYPGQKLERVHTLPEFLNMVADFVERSVGGDRPAVDASYARKSDQPPKEAEFTFTYGLHTVQVGNSVVVYKVHEDDKVALCSIRTPIRKRGKGSGRAALRAFLAAVDKQGVPEVWLGASPLDKRTYLGRLVQFYQSEGFEMTGRSYNPAGDPEMVRRKPN